jgi:light-regulated signal transduction histidine kinase (bacteriophytochrome)
MSEDNIICPNPCSRRPDHGPAPLDTLENLQNALERHSAELDAVTKELDAYSYGVSHHLRAPIRVIDEAAKALLSETPLSLSAKSRDQLRRLLRETSFMASLSNALLELSRAGRAPLRQELHNVRALLKPIIFKLKTTMPTRQAEFHVPSDLEIFGDYDLLRIAFGHVLENAWKFTVGNDLTEIEIGETRIDGRGILFVQDNGIGFDPAEQDRLFVPFGILHSRTDYPGHGLGLAIVRRIVHRHHGRVWTVGQPHQGVTIFLIFLRTNNPSLNSGAWRPHEFRG